MHCERKQYEPLSRVRERGWGEGKLLAEDLKPKRPAKEKARHSRAFLRSITPKRQRVLPAEARTHGPLLVTVVEHLDVAIDAPVLVQLHLATETAVEVAFRADAVLLLKSS